MKISIISRLFIQYTVIFVVILIYLANKSLSLLSSYEKNDHIFPDIYIRAVSL